MQFSKILSLFTPDNLFIILSTAHLRFIAVGLELIKFLQISLKMIDHYFQIIAKTNP